MYPLYSLLNLKTPNLGLRISRIGFKDPGTVVTRARGWTNYCRQERSKDLGWPQNHPEKSSYVKPGSRATKVMTIGLKAIQNHEKSAPGIKRIPASAKVDLCNTSYAKSWVSHSQTSRFRRKNQQKKKPGNKHKRIQLFCSKKAPTKLSKWDP